MNFSQNHLYHIYNRGNRSIPIFYQERNYDFFLHKLKVHISPYADILAYCLMPNHFHLLIKTHENSFDLNDQIGIMLRSYTRAINNQEGQVGSLFQSGTKAKDISHKEGLPLICFNYIHLNPLRAALVDNLLKWPYSSFLFYAGSEINNLVSKESATDYIDIDFGNYATDIFGYLPYWDSYHGLL